MGRTLARRCRACPSDRHEPRRGDHDEIPVVARGPRHARHRRAPTRWLGARAVGQHPRRLWGHRFPIDRDYLSDRWLLGSDRHRWCVTTPVRDARAAWIGVGIYGMADGRRARRSQTVGSRSVKIVSGMCLPSSDEECTRRSWRRLASALRQHASLHDVVSAENTEYGVKYRIVGALPTPDERNPTVRTLWIVLHGDDVPRFITAVPHDRRRR